MDFFFEKPARAAIDRIKRCADINLQCWLEWIDVASSLTKNSADARPIKQVVRLQGPRSVPALAENDDATVANVHTVCHIIGSKITACGQDKRTHE
jgi:hypothetical protein